MNEKILFVDDEPSILEGYKRLLGRELSIETAVGGIAGLAAIATSGPYAVVISDMRMPQMNGAQFLAKVREIAPSTTRLALTGYMDIETAMCAVNEGNIFRFLTKPCLKESLLKAIEASLEQSRLVNAEKELLEQTLRGSVQVLCEVLSFSNPAAFGRGMRLRRFVQHVAMKMKLKSTWQLEIAAMLSQLGCVTLAPEIMNAAYAGERLAPEDQKKYDAHPSVAWEMLSRIPRMEVIAQMIAGQNDPNPHVEARTVEEQHEIEFGIQLLQTGLAFEGCLGGGLSPIDAARSVGASLKGFDESLLESLKELASSAPMRTRECSISDLAIGMMLHEPIWNSNGLLIVEKGQELTFQWIKRLGDLAQRGVIGSRVNIWLPQNSVI